MGQELERAVAGDHRLHSITIGLPLLSSEADIRKVAGIMVNGMVPAERRPDEAVVWMGHGSRHHAEDAVYGALATALRQHDPLTFLGTVEGRLTRDHVAADVRKSGARRAWLLPFMAVAGDHARNDLAGSAEGSWKSLLESEGLRCVPVLKGIAEYQAIADVWLDHLASAREALTVQ
jgi:sirohydrochlorin cobaltochelatase